MTFMGNLHAGGQTNLGHEPITVALYDYLCIIINLFACDFLNNNILVYIFDMAAIDYLGGWAAFNVSIIAIGVLTCLIGDVASSFGCTIGLKDSVVAISFVALGTSLPGL